MPDLFVRLDGDRTLNCWACGNSDDYRVPVIVDWRDRAAVSALARCCPDVPCRHCGQPVAMDTPILVIRPGDPIPLLAGVPFHTEADRDAGTLADFIKLLTRLDAPVAAAAPAVARLDHLPELAARYTGFALTSTTRWAGAASWTAQSHAWLAAVATEVAVPPVLDELTSFVQAEDEAQARAIASAAGSLTRPEWFPVVAVIGRLLVAAQETSEAAETVHQRLLLINRLQWPAELDLPAESGLQAEAMTLLSVATGAGQGTLADRRVALTRLAQRLRSEPDAEHLLAGTLISLSATISRSPDRTVDDLELAVSAGVEAVPIADRVFGPDHTVTLTAMQDLAAALMDRAAGDRDENIEGAIELLETAAVRAARATNPVLCDIVHNLAGAYAHRNTDGRTNNQERAVALYQDAIHLNEVLRGHDQRSAALTRLNQAAALRERRSMDRMQSTLAALAAYDRVLGDPDTLAELFPHEQALAWSNRASALYQLRTLDTGRVTAAEVIAATRTALRLADRIGVGDPIRLSLLSSCGSMLGDLYQDDVRLGLDVDDALLDEGIEATGKAYAEAQPVLASSHEDLLRLGQNHAANLGRPRAGGGPDVAGVERHLLDLLSAAQGRLPGRVSPIARNLGRLYCGIGRWAEAAEMFDRAMSAVEQLYDESRTAATQLAELGEAADLVGWMVVALLQAGQPRAAVAAIERSRARILRDSRSRAPGPAQPVVYLGVGPLATWIILVRPGHEPAAFLTTLTSTELRPLVTALRAARSTVDLAAALAAVGEQLQPAVLGPTAILLDEHHITDIAIVASGLLSGVPLHVLPADPRTGDCLLDRMTVRYIPSAAVEDQLRRRPSSAEQRALAVVNPDGDLSYLRYGAELVARAYGPVTQPPDIGDRAAWLRRDAHRYTHVHLACHAQWNPGHPLESEIRLGGPRALRLAEMFDLGLDNVELAVLCCCSTGVTSEPSSDEIVGFGTGLLLGGAKSVIVSNWDVRDRSGAFVMCRFYQELSTGQHPAEAIRTAQLWVARVTDQELEAAAQATLAGAPGAFLAVGLAHEILGVLRRRKLDPAHRRFAELTQWGTFSYYGPGRPAPIG